MATDSRGHAPGDETPDRADMPSGWLITARDDDPLEYRGEIGDISRSGVQIPPSPFLSKSFIPECSLSLRTGQVQTDPDAIGV